MKILSFLSFVVLLIPFSLTGQPGKTTPDQSGNDSSSGKKEPPIWNNITFLNAANFDFTGEVSGSYLGKLNIFAPDIKNSAFGFNAGIMRIKFNYKDSANSTYYQENRLIHPLDEVKLGEKYLRQYNKYTTTRSNTVWSFYAQPMFRIVSWPYTKKDGSTKSKARENRIYPNGIYLHLHLELLINKTNVTTSVQSLQQDTAVIKDTSLTYVRYLPNPLIFDKTFLNGYYGIGITFNLDPFSNGNSRFFFQPTVGLTTNYPNWTSQDITSSAVIVSPTRGGTTVGQPGTGTRGTNVQGYNGVKSSAFYLIRAEFSQLLSSNSQLILGTDIRGLFPKFNPLYAAYIGLNVNLDALVKVISDKK